MLQNTLTYLKKLKANNDREWFQANKDAYLTSDKEIKAFAFEVQEKLAQHDHIDEGGSKIYRIYRDVRFSKDKTPYKTNRSGSFSRASNALRGGYYFSISPGSSFVAGGFFGPNAEDLLHIRKQISQDPDPLRDIISDRDFQSTFGAVSGEAVKTAPKGFSKDDPAIDLIRQKQWILEHSFSDQAVLSADFDQKVVDVYNAMRPFLDYMTEILTTDLNGVSRI